MFNFIAIFVFIGSVLGQDSQTDATCNPQPIVNYNFGTDGVFGLKGQKGERGQTDETRDELREMRTQIDELRNELQSANRLTRQILLRGFVELDDGWISPLNGYQYKLISTSQPWNESRTMCQSLGGDLIVHGFQDPTARLTISVAFGLRNPYWIGLSDHANEGNWRWVNGYQANTDDDSLWWENRPSTGTAGGRIDCVRSYFDDDFGRATFFAWDVSCSLSYGSICEKPN